MEGGEEMVRGGRGKVGVRGKGTYLLVVHDVHDHAALEHAGQSGLDGKGRGAVAIALGVVGAVGGGEVAGHCCGGSASRCSGEACR